MEEVSGRWLLAGLRWSAEAVAARLHPLRPVPGGAETLMPLEGEIAFTVGGTRSCTGYVDLAASVTRPCPDGAPLERGTICARCRAREGLWPCISCPGDRCEDRRLTPPVREYCQRLHHLYLAWFGGDVVKVGTASAVRGAVRLWDQGAVCAAFVASGPGPAIKRLERRVHALGHPMQVARGQKARWALAGIDPGAGAPLIEAAHARIARALDPAWRDALDPAPEWVPPAAPAARWPANATPRELRLRPGTGVAGSAVASRGSLLLLRVEGRLRLLDLAELRGAPVELGRAADISPPTEQLAFF